MRQEWSPEDVVACWTLVDGDWGLVANKSGPTRLGFCLMLKFFEIEGRFPEFIEEFPQPAVEYVAGLVRVSVAELAKYDLAGAKRHRKQIREALGFRPALFWSNINPYGTFRLNMDKQLELRMPVTVPSARRHTARAQTMSPRS